MSHNRFLLLYGGSGGATPVVVPWLSDDFLDAHAAGSLNGTLATDGVNVRTTNDSLGTRLKTAANGLEFLGDTGAGDPGLWYPSRALVGGTAVAWRVKPVTNPVPLVVGFDNNAAGNARDGIYFINTALRVFFAANQINVLSRVYSTGVVYDCVTVKTNPGVLYFIKGGEFTDWTLAFVSTTGTDDPVFPVISTNAGGVGGFSAYAPKVRGATLSQFASRYAYATQRKATSVNGDTIAASNGNAIIEHTITAATGVTQELMVRRTDDNNCLIIRMDQTAAKIYLYEKVAGVETEIGATGGIAQTWTNGSQFRIHVTLYGTVVDIVVSNTLKQATTSSVNTSVTGVKVSHAGADLIAWPLVPTGAAKAELDTFFPA